MTGCAQAAGDKISRADEFFGDTIIERISSCRSFSRQAFWSE
jgi:hypothetical protein